MAEWHQQSATELGAGIAAGRIDPVDLAEHFLARIAELDTDHAVFITRTPERARTEAMAARKRQREGCRLGPLDGVPVAWKDLFDSAGTPTTAGSSILRERVPGRDATALARATRAGLVCLGKTNMTGVRLFWPGHQPHLRHAGEPRRPGNAARSGRVQLRLRRCRSRAGLRRSPVGSDTGGSIRIPSAWNGLVGLKPGWGQVPSTGTLPLAPSLDTFGPLARTASDANLLYAVLAGTRPADLTGVNLSGLRLAVADTVVWEDAEDAVMAATEAAISRLAKAGARIERVSVPEFSELVALQSRLGGLGPVEAYATWQRLVDEQGEQIYHNVRARFLQGRDMSGTATVQLYAGIAELKTRLKVRLASMDALLAPTVAIAPPPIEELASDDEAYGRANRLALRNTSFANTLDWCGGDRSLPRCRAIARWPDADAGQRPRSTAFAPCPRDRTGIRDSLNARPGIAFRYAQTIGSPFWSAYFLVLHAISILSVDSDQPSTALIMLFFSV